METLARQIETQGRDAQDCNPGSGYRADGTLGNTDSILDMPFECHQCLCLGIFA